MCAAAEIGILNRQGMRALADGNTANAEFLLTQALRRSQTRQLTGFMVKLHNNLGLTLLLANRPAEAAAHFQSALVFTRRYPDSKLHALVGRHLAEARLREKAHP